MDTAPTFIVLCLITFPCWRVIAFETSNVTVTTELRRIIHAYTLHRDGQLAHLPEIHRVSHLHKEFDRIKQLTQHKPHIRSLCRAVLLNHHLNILQGDYTPLHGVRVVLAIVLTALNLVLQESVLYRHSLFVYKGKTFY